MVWQPGRRRPPRSPALLAQCSGNTILLPLKQSAKRGRYFCDLVFIEIKEDNANLCLADNGFESAIGNLHTNIETVAVKIAHAHINDQSVTSERLRAKINGKVRHNHTETENIPLIESETGKKL